uniref:Zinc finger protein 236 n=1 Tax=Phallusia mammillata TaxID=59560 RepID=A0A6F9DX27_9ASCI|nr:zinc finger protein 236 [Phallusia mammillata]
MQFSCDSPSEASIMSLNYSSFQLNSVPTDSSNFLLSTLNNSLQATCNTSQSPLFQTNGQDSNDLRHVCRVCGKHFRASSLLDIHMRVHVGAKPFVCPVCNHRATQKGNLKLHMKKHHGQDLPPNIDIIPDSGIWGNFDKNFVQPSSVVLDPKKSQAHSSLLDPEVVELIKKCQNNIGQSGMGRITESLKDFIEMAQNRQSSTDCQDSKAWKWDSNNSNNNVLSEIPTSKEQLHNAAMQICKRFLQNNIESKITLQQKNDANKVLEKKPESLVSCQICGWETTSPGYLNVHMRKHKEESHVCSICGRSFKETWYLKNHMRSHINDLTSGPNQLLPDSVNHIVSSNGHMMKPLKSTSVSDALKPKDADEYSVPFRSLYSACDNCGQIFNNKSLVDHSTECKDAKTKARSLCKLCEKETSEEMVKKNFTETLNLCELKLEDNTENRTPFVSELNPLIGCLTVSKVTEASSVPPMDVPVSQPTQKEVLRQEILKSMNKREAQQQLSRKISAIVQSNTLKHEHSTDNLSKSHPNLNLISKSSPDNNLQPYRNPAMQSLAEIGKTLLPTGSPVQNHHNESFRPADAPLKMIPADKQINGMQQGFQCRFCLKWFKYRSVLGIHMRSHTGERPYKCSYCGYAGTQHNCLKLHIQRHHPKEYMATHNNMIMQNKIHLQTAASVPKLINSRDESLLNEQAAKFSPAHCPICGRVSPSPGYLKIHMRSHKKTLDHVCHICGRGFKEYWYLSTHLRTHNRETTCTQNFSALPLQHPSSPISQASALNSFHENFNSSFLKNGMPLDKADTNSESSRLPQHPKLKQISSWSPLTTSIDDLLHQQHEFTSDQAEESSMNSHPLATKMLSAPSYVSKRKAFQPSKWHTKPYDCSPEMDDNSSRRKSKPRKVSHGSYLNPVFKKLSPLQHEEMDMLPETEELETEMDDPFNDDDEKPLDLSVATTTVTCPDPVEDFETEQNYDEPLNLALK